MFNAVASRITQIMLLKAGPQDLPTSPSLLQLATALFLATAIARLLLVSDLTVALVQSALSIVILAVFVRALLNWKRTPERFVQTMTALFLTSAVIGLLLLLPLDALQPLLKALTENPDISPEQLEIPAMAMYAWAGLSIWGLVISAHIYRHALDISFGFGVCVALLYEILLIFIVGFLSSLFGGV
ncbi:hypothetical protein ATO7_04835 [Oceanococcus atlanticus]|uniref:Yip1 domain-containing protein n=1 Tax=Oceanococcus atlanticus TaxID=1317117 RepID=A0A1Y1SHP5_9GAMM|nr:hypothetical protein [Oceanococcus atlanticus]ORE89176.1 hypothetical protein ATO7_04835 [Oceanococcus atlanticus]